MEILKVFGSTNLNITSLQVIRKDCDELFDSKLVLGFEDGSIEIFNNFNDESSNKYKLHRKKITSIEYFKDNKVLIGSLDGSFSTLDLDIYTEKITHINSSICKAFYNNNLIFCACNDRTVRIFDNLKLIDQIVFKDFIKDIFIKGEELFVILNSGQALLVDYKTKVERVFSEFKKFRNLVVNLNYLLIHCSRKVFIYEIGKTFKFIRSIDTDENIRRVDICNNSGRIVMFGKNNSVEMEDSGKQMNFFHKNEIIDIKVINDEVFTLSKDKLLIWSFNKDELFITTKIDLVGGICFVVVGDEIVIGTDSNLISINRNSFDKNILLENKIYSLAVNKNHIAVCSKEIIFYNFEWKEVNRLTPKDTVTYSSFYGTNLFAFSCMDSKIYVYSYPNLDLKFTLYGHSLPIRSFKFSPDGTLLTSCGADKLIKVWGMDFGECRKTFIGDSLNVEYVDDELFLYYNDGIIYNRKFSKLRKYKSYERGLIAVNDDFMIFTTNQGLAYYSIDEAGLIEGEEDDDEFDKVILKEGLIIDLKGYERFVGYLENIEENSNILKGEFYNFLVGLDLLEVLNYISLLDVISIKIILKELEENIDVNIIFNTRVFIKLYEYHEEIVKSYENYEQIKIGLIECVGKIRNKTGELCFKTKMFTNFIE
ncbi:WDR3 [Hepatospora eriocheir]|uniref:WDR3 n=1 Tax=Hepatospora eriocheir TaxID=1081669 RepID=A0A1X0QCD1_9MICR|nr:WDR3 [Hepatospora eriocheir]